MGLQATKDSLQKNHDNHRHLVVGGHLVLDVEEERKQREVGRDINGTPGNRRTRGGKRQLETVIETGCRDSLGEMLGTVCAVALAVTQWSPDCYIYQAAVCC